MVIGPHQVTATALTLIVLASVGCSADRGDNHDLLVSAAASLTNAFVEIEAAFEEAHPTVDVILNLGGTTALREQVLEGAPVDVFVSADRSNMDRVVDAGEVFGKPEVFAHNNLQIAVPAGNPAKVTGLEDFGREDLLIGLCAEEVPCGELARQALRMAGVTPVIDTNEPDVRALLTRVEAGELDAGITYVTDVLSSSGRVDGVVISEELNAPAEYWIAVLANAPNADAAVVFVSFLLSGEGQAILGQYGFVPR